MMMAPFSMTMAPLVGLVIDATGKVYHYTFATGCVLALIGLAMAFVVHRQFMKLGGPKGYVAPV